MMSASPEDTSRYRLRYFQHCLQKTYFLVLPNPTTDPPFSYSMRVEKWDPRFGVNRFGVERFGVDVFSMNGIAQATYHDLERLFSGECLDEKKHTKKWFATQLELYGIHYAPHEETAPIASSKALLESAFNDGKCNRLLDSMAEKRDRLKAEYMAAFKELEDKLFTKLRCRELEYAIDPARFLSKFFLDAEGNPDREKTKTILVLQRFLWEELEEMVKTVPRLAFNVRSEKHLLIGWEDLMPAALETEWQRIQSTAGTKKKLHSLHALFDLDRFLSHYLHIDATDDGTKTKCIREGPKPEAPVLLDCQSHSCWRMEEEHIIQQILAAVPADHPDRLHLKRFNEHTFVIGWNRTAVDAEFCRLKEEYNLYWEKENDPSGRGMRQEGNLFKKYRWDRRCMKAHQELREKHDVWPMWHWPEGKQVPSLSLSHLPGSYRLQWQAEDEEQGKTYNDPEDDGDVMRLDVFPPDDSSSPGLMASFNFGLVKGVMVLALSKQDLELMVKSQTNHTDPSNPEGTLDDNDNHKTQPVTVGEKRSLAGPSTRSSKRQKTGHGQREADRSSNSNLNRVYFQFVCTEVDGKPLGRDNGNNKHVEHFDFEPKSDMLTATGEYLLTEVFGDNAQSLSVFKISHEPEGKREDLRG